MDDTLKNYEVTFDGKYTSNRETVTVKAFREVEARRMAWDWLAGRRCTSRYILIKIREVPS